jgi:hypothetical protein
MMVSIANTEPWHFVQSFDDIAKGRECSRYASVEGRNAFLQLFDCAEMLGKKKAMVLTDPALRRLAQGRPSTAEPLATERCKLLGVRFACDYRRQDTAATRPHDITDHRSQLDLCLFQNCLNALDVLNNLARQLLARPREIAQLLDRSRRHEARPDEAMGQ